MKNHLFAILPLALALGIACGLSRPGSKSDDAIKAATIGIGQESGEGSWCSGVQVKAPSGQAYILSAAHCREIDSGDGYPIVTQNGRHLMRSFVAEDPASDLLLIEGVPGLPALEISDKMDKELKSVRAFTRGGRMPLYITSGDIIKLDEIAKFVIFPLHSGENTEESDCLKGSKFMVFSAETMFGNIQVCLFSAPENAISAKIVPGSSGGAIVDERGDLAGIASATDGDFGYMVRLQDIRAFVGNY